MAYAAQALIKLANNHGSRDNISVAQVQARKHFSTRQGWPHLFKDPIIRLIEEMHAP